MKKEWLLAMCATAMMASCAKDKTIALDNGADGTPEEIILGAGQYLSAEVEQGQLMKAASRGIGSVGDLSTGTNQWDGETVYVYGIVSALEEGQFVINGIQAIADTGTPNGAISQLSWVDSDTHYYYDGNNLYDFYGCHVDDAEIGTQDGSMTIPDDTDLTTAGFSVPITIDGTQDLMVAMPDKSKDIEGNLEVTNTDNLYSAWSSRRGVKPNLVFQHVLTRLTFKAKCGDASAPAQPVKITSIQVTGAISDGTLTVIPANSGTQGFVAGTTTANFALMGPDLDPKTQKLANFSGKDITNVDPEDFEQIGASMMLVPGGEYTIVITTEQDMNNNSTIDANEKGTITKKITYTGGFVAGTNYNINITVYGLQEIAVNATLTAWNEAGEDIEIDPDDINPPTPSPVP